MPVRKKTAIEKFFSLNQHRKKWGAKKIQNKHINYHALKNSILKHGQRQQVTQASKSLETHIENLKSEFSGQPELLHYHAKLIVLIRREIAVKKNYQLFCELWACEADFLSEHLDIRWLVSAADTIADNDNNAEMRNIALMASLLVNTVKLYETERYLEQRDSPEADISDPIANLMTQEPLFDGLRCFAVGRDDTLRNLHWRIQAASKLKPAGQILNTVYNRLQNNNTAFSRFRNLTPHPRTAWW